MVTIVTLMSYKYINININIFEVIKKKHGKDIYTLVRSFAKSKQNI